jgi:hypothetical protein
MLTIRPDSWNLPLLLHVLGAMLLVGTLVVVLASLVLARRGGADGAALERLAVRTMLLGVIPSYLVMRIAAQWIASKEGLDNEGVSLTWLDIGFTTADIGALIVVVTAVLLGIAARRSRRPDARGGGLYTAAAALTALLLVAYIVAVWAMSAKPT